MTTSPKFEQAIATVLKHEGGWVNNKADPGGATNHGVSLRFALAQHNIAEFDIDHDGDVDADDIKKLSVDDAKRIYKDFFWDKGGYEAIVNYGVATKVFDMAVNMGPAQAHKIVQRACNDFAGNNLVVDGALGPKSFSIINSLPGDQLLAVIREMQAHFYLDLIAKKPKLAVFKDGWINRSMA